MPLVGRRQQDAPPLLSAADRKELTHEFLRELAELAPLLSDLEERTDRVAGLGRLLGFVGESPKTTTGSTAQAPKATTRPPRPAKPRQTKPRPPRFSDPIYVELARRGIGEIGFDRADTKPFFVVIDETRFEITKREKAVLRELTNVTGVGQDGFPVCVDYGSFARRVARSSGQPMSRHLAIVIVGRLKGRFRAAGVSPALIEYVRDEGVRLRVRRTPR